MPTIMYKTVADRLENCSKVILVHGNADMDAIGSAYALSLACGDATIYAPNGIDRVAKMVADKMDIPIHEKADLSQFERVIVVDTSSPEQLSNGTEMDFPDDTIVIDHHVPSGKWNEEYTLCDTTKVACTQIILRIIKASGKTITKEIGLALIGGMITDGGHFQFSTSELLRDFADVMDEAGIDMDEAFALTKSEIGMSERIAMMKCVERSRFERVGDMIVAVAIGGSFEASGCRALLTSGADVAFVASQRDDSFRLSARTTQDIMRRGLHLGEILKGLGTETCTEGGGHGGAAGMSGIGDAEAMLHMCMKRTMDVFRDIKKAYEKKE